MSEPARAIEPRIPPSREALAAAVLIDSVIETVLREDFGVVRQKDTGRFRASIAETVQWAINQAMGRVDA